MKVPEFEGTTMLAGVLEANASTDALMSSRIAAAGNLQASAILSTRQTYLYLMWLWNIYLMVMANILISDGREVVMEYISARFG